VAAAAARPFDATAKSATCDSVHEGACVVISPTRDSIFRYMQTPHHLTAGTPLTSAADTSATPNLFGLGPVPKNQTKN
jgi:hypothetical protein